eukprot:TRINITY_DN2075_c1_g1_i1.p2 TRINITY_DN2075_c1_g1~~TRINITY_DN2075_c1_g1_i1.p2  ORF type:complete len:280 (+),score=65.09 TRINITY_DN2075_c1_g1_i1:53-841(+)
MLCTAHHDAATVYHGLELLQNIKLDGCFVPWEPLDGLNLQLRYVNIAQEEQKEEIEDDEEAEMRSITRTIESAERTRIMTTAHSDMEAIEREWLGVLFEVEIKRIWFAELEESEETNRKPINVYREDVYSWLASRKQFLLNISALQEEEYLERIRAVRGSLKTNLALKISFDSVFTSLPPTSHSRSVELRASILNSLQAPAPPEEKKISPVPAPRSFHVKHNNNNNLLEIEEPTSRNLIKKDERAGRRNILQEKISWEERFY